MTWYICSDSEFQYASTEEDGEPCADCRPVVVIDPEDREQVALILSRYHDWKWTPEIAEASITDMQAALREFANPKPRVKEPTGTYAVVRASDGSKWCHIGGQVWRSLTSTGPYVVEKHWHDSDSPLNGRVDAILSEGIAE